MLASDSGHTDVVQLLLSSGAQVDLQDEVRHNINLLIVHKTDGRTTGSKVDQQNKVRYSINLSLSTLQK